MPKKASVQSKTVDHALPPIRFFNTLPIELIRHLSDEFLDERGQMALSMASKSHRQCYQASQARILSENLLQWIAEGKRHETDKRLARLNSESKQSLLLMQGNIIDYSKRSFENITAYEYAYWAKDTHACRMLAAHMNFDTRATMLERILKIEHEGLTYTQHGQTITGSKHFELIHLINALTSFANLTESFLTDEGRQAAEHACKQIAIAQRDVPAHVVQEYCRPDLDFLRGKERFQASASTLPEHMHYYQSREKTRAFWFEPMEAYVYFAVRRGWVRNRAVCCGGREGQMDLNAVIANDLEGCQLLDTIRTEELLHARENLGMSDASAAASYAAIAKSPGI